MTEIIRALSNYGKLCIRDSSRLGKTEKWGILEMSFVHPFSESFRILWPGNTIQAKKNLSCWVWEARWVPIPLPCPFFSQYKENLAWRWIQGLEFSTQQYEQPMKMPTYVFCNSVYQVFTCLMSYISLNLLRFYSFCPAFHPADQETDAWSHWIHRPQWLCRGRARIRTQAVGTSR